MTKQEIISIASDIMSKYDGMKPGNICKIQTLEANYMTTDKHNKFLYILNLLLINDFLNYDEHWVRLTDKGFSYLHGEILIAPLLVDLKDLLNLKLPIDKIFYELWEVIGGDNSNREDLNPYYVKGPMFYDVAKGYLQGYPPTYSQYMKDLEANRGKKESRLVWCKELFLAIGKDNIESFLDNLSAKINGQLEKNEITEMNEENLGINQLKIQDSMNPKIFISHKSEDLKGFVKPLVDMMLSLGVSEKDIFCSSYPGFGVPFSKPILDCLATQFNEFHLMVLFVHSPRYYHSTICMNEMGAAWILKNEHYSFLTKDCEWNMLTGVVHDKDASFRAGQEDTYHLLNDFKENLEKFFGLEPKSVTRWETIKKDFLEAVCN